jgi:hypothetical protein
MTIEQFTDRDLEKLTQAEKLWIWRHRQLSQLSRRKPTRQSTVLRDGRRMTRAEAAEILGLTETVYAQLEIGDALLSSEERAAVRARLVAMGPPTAGELCTIARRRSGGGLRAVEGVLGVSRPKMMEMERCGAAPLIRYWETHGYTFPSG